MTKLLVVLSIGLGCGLTLIGTSIFNAETATTASHKTRDTDTEVKNKATFYFTEQSTLVRITDSDFGTVCYMQRNGTGSPSCIQIAMPMAGKDE